MKTKLEKYEAVNKCETVDELADVMLNVIANDMGEIVGRSRPFSVNKMIKYLHIFVEDDDDRVSPSVLTRMYGIRQQAMYIKYYTDK
jgi:hypothetical protein